MKPPSSGAVLIKRPFDLQEAVVLLDVYLGMVKNGVSISMAAEKASIRLRNLAKRNGYAVSESYRSAGGLVNRLRSLGGLYEGQESRSAPGTAMFAEAISLYNNDRAQYEEILSTEEEASQTTICDEQSPNTQRKTEVREKRRSGQMAENQNAAERNFFQWLPTAVTASVLADIKNRMHRLMSCLLNSMCYRRHSQMLLL